MELTNQLTSPDGSVLEIRRDEKGQPIPAWPLEQGTELYKWFYRANQPAVRDERLMACGAKTRGGWPCQGKPMPNGRCRKHRGKAVSGPDHHNFKTGRWSKVLNQAHRERYEASIADMNILVMTDEIGLIDAQIETVLLEMSQGGTWDDLGRLNSRIQKAVRNNEGDALFEALTELNELSTAQGEIGVQERRLTGLLEQRRRLVESERKRLVEAQDVLYKQDMFSIIATLGDFIHRYVPDPDERRKAAAELREFATTINSLTTSGRN